MTYKTLLVHMTAGVANSNLLRVADRLATRFGSKVIGIVACQPTAMEYGDGYATGVFTVEAQRELDREINEAEAAFRTTFNGAKTGVEWRSATIFGSIAEFVTYEADLADLILTGGRSRAADGGLSKENPGDIVLQAGRPVLVVPRSENTAEFNRIVIAWKNTRESRRAVADAVPLLRDASQVTVMQIAHEDSRTRVTRRLTEICEFLATHGVTAEARFVASADGNDAYQLNVAVEELGADMVVAGAYGHSRLREWALGGVTRDLTLQANYCALLSN